MIRCHSKYTTIYVGVKVQITLQVDNMINILEWVNHQLDYLMSYSMHNYLFMHRYNDLQQFWFSSKLISTLHSCL